MKHALVAALFLAASGTAIAQFKCTGPDGKVAFQEAPCDRSAAAQRLDLAKPAPDDGRQHVRDALARGRFVTGMNRREIDRVMGVRPEVSRSWVAGMEIVHLTYRYADRTVYMTLRDGLLDSFTDTGNVRP